MKLLWKAFEIIVPSAALVSAFAMSWIWLMSKTYPISAIALIALFIGMGTLALFAVDCIWIIHVLNNEE